MTDHEAVTEQTKREFRVLCRRYGVSVPSDSIYRRYMSWHALQTPPSQALDKSLLAVTRLGRFGAWLASAYAGRFARRSTLRRFEVALLGFLECDANASRIIDESRAGGPLGAWLRFFFWGFLEVVGLLLALPLFGPLQLFGGRA